MKIIVSSAYYRIEIPSLTRCDTTPEICASSLALFIKMANMSVTKLKSNGDNGSPCRRPFLV
jgi:hypothetical protein